MKLGIFGGTFDPPHVGHLIVAQDAALALGLDRVLFVPAADPPHKRERTVTAGTIRRRMLECAVAGNARFGVDPLELDASLSYTVDTLRALQSKHEGAELWLLIGLDQWREFATWRKPDEIRELAKLAVIRRGTDVVGSQSRASSPGAPAGSASDAQAAPRFIDATRIDISSSEIRRRVGLGESVRYLVPDGVIEIIFREQLYR